MLPKSVREESKHTMSDALSRRHSETMTMLRLIRPPLDSWYSVKQLENLISIPAGLNLLAKKTKHLVDTSVYDGMYLPLQNSLDHAVGDYVGVTVLYSMHENALTILKEAKKNGATTIIGGYHVNPLAKRILANNNYIDYAIVEDGEAALPKLLAGEKPELIPGLVYRKGNHIESNTPQAVRLDTIFDLEELINFDNFNKDHYFPISSIRGCVKAAKSERCTFCSITNKLRLMNPTLVWEQVRTIKEHYGVTRFWETGDLFTVGNFPQRLLMARPKELSDVSFKIYVSPNYVTKELAETLAQLNITEIFLGIETIDDAILAAAKKEFREADIRQAVQLLKAYPFEIHLPFLYGLPGETTESAQRTYQFAQEAVNTLTTSKIVCSIPLPLAGTELFTNLRTNPKVRKQYAGDLDKDDHFDWQALLKLQLEHYTSVSYEEMLEKVEQTRLLAPIGGRSGFDHNH